MDLPKTGRVIVVDDQHEEGLALIKTLSRNGISTHYFTGDVEDLPEKKINCIRVIFLDIELDTEGQSDKTKLSKVKSVLDKLIDKSNGPYLVIAWTQHIDLIRKLKKVLNDNPPHIILSLDKGACKNQTDGKFSFDLIKSAIDSELTKSGMFKVFNIWEGIISESSHSIINDIANFYKPDVNWEKNISRVFYRLAQAYSGSTLDANNNGDILKNSLLAFNSVFFDTVENNISNHLWNQGLATIETKGRIDTIPLSKINTKLHLVLKPKTDLHPPGTVYFIKASKKFKKDKIIGFYLDSTALKHNYAKSISVDPQILCDENGSVNASYLEGFKTYKQEIVSDLFRNMSTIKIEISPECDFIQSKKVLHRFVLGVLWPHKYIHLVKSRTDFLYTSPVFFIRNAPHHLLLDMRYLSSQRLRVDIKSKVAFRVRHELIVEIQNSLSNYISRPGVLFLDHRL